MTDRRDLRQKMDDALARHMKKKTRIQLRDTAADYQRAANELERVKVGVEEYFKSRIAELRKAEEINAANTLRFEVDRMLTALGVEK